MDTLNDHSQRKMYLNNLVSIYSYADSMTVNTPIVQLLTHALEESLDIEHILPSVESLLACFCSR